MSAASRSVGVIGGGGFIGRPLVARLAAQGMDVRVLGLGRALAPVRTRWLQCDIRDTGALDAALRGCEVVYNLAAAHGLDRAAPAEFHDVNVGGARSLCQAAATAGVRRIVFTSTAAVYGRNGAPDEQTIPAPRGPYAVSKLSAEQTYRAWAMDADARSLVIVRPTVVFGPGGGGVGGRLLRHLAGPDFAHEGSARNHKSLAFVENLASFLGFVLDGPVGVDTYNYADAPDLTLAEIASIVRAAVGLPDAPRRSMASAWAGSAGAAIVGAVRRTLDPRRRARGATMRHLARDTRFSAAKAHASGFRQPVLLREALSVTARAEVQWVAWLSRARG